MEFSFFTNIKAWIYKINLKLLQIAEVMLHGGREESVKNIIVVEAKINSYIYTCACVVGNVTARKTRKLALQFSQR
jgi:hypothetical protein